MQQKSRLKAGMSLSPVDKLAIRLARAYGYSTTSTVMLFGVSPGTVRRLCQDVPMPPAGRSGPEEAAEPVLRRVTLTEIGAEQGDNWVWTSLRQSAERVLAALSAGTTVQEMFS